MAAAAAHLGSEEIDQETFIENLSARKNVRNSLAGSSGVGSSFGRSCLDEIWRWRSFSFNHGANWAVKGKGFETPGARFHGELHEGRD